jgi:hypothetical protein
MRIKFGRIWGNSLTLSHFEKKARKITDLAAIVNDASGPDRHHHLASPARAHDALNHALFVINVPR